MANVKDILGKNNVSRSYTEGRYIVFVLKNGMKIKLNPNESGVTDNGGTKNARYNGQAG